MHELYELKKEDLQKQETVCPYREIEISKLTGELFGGRGYIAFFWNVITAGKGKAYIIRDKDGSIIHSTCVMPKCWKFPFMKKKDIHIGPSVTHPRFRGQGLFPYVMSAVVENELQEGGRAFDMINVKNAASIKASKKIGLVPVALMRKDKLGRHTPIKWYQSLEEAQNEFFR